MKRYLPIAIIAGVLILALGGGLILWQATRQTPAKTPEQSFVPATPTPTAPQASPTATPATQQSPTPAAADNAHARGALNAKVTLEEYGDYQCPSCGTVFFLLKNLEKDYSDRVRFVFRQYPLPGHKHAMIAAQAAEAADLQGRFWEMHDMIYENQANWSAAEDARVYFLQYARNLGMDVDQFNRDMNSPEVSRRVLTDKEMGTRAGVSGTPTIFINGQQVRPEVVTDEGLRMALNYMLGKTK
ncbi:MAG TPA: thioredoxin domain-containing protein [Pyrinomonadaceae bacterium]